MTAKNGVSDQDPDSVSDRTTTITGSTTEGGKGKIYSVLINILVALDVVAVLE